MNEVLHAARKLPRVAGLAPEPAAPAKTRVLLISLFHPELLRGGAQQVCYELFQGLREQPDVERLLARLDRCKHPGLFKSGRAHHRLRRPARTNSCFSAGRLRSLVAQDRLRRCMIEAFVEFLETIRPDVVHFHHFITFGIDLLTLTRRILPECRIILPSTSSWRSATPTAIWCDAPTSRSVRRPARSAAINAFRSARRSIS